ncbi:hypothetical protein ACQEV9_44320 [Streptomyces chartreusis]|uniref:hypothetical protein n=1 Tax=Streptomyces chartreusis TaxID=1969 RepID=UPI003D91B732
MDLEGIGAVAAAGAALFGVPVAFWVGHRQVKAAVQTAEATYRAALDGVRAQGFNEQAQWRRSVRRDAYASMLQTALEYREHADKVYWQALRGPSDIPAVMQDADPLRAVMSHKALVVSLEGPDEMSDTAHSLVVAADAVMYESRKWASDLHCRWLLEQRATAHRQEVERIRDLQASFRSRGYPPQFTTRRMTDEAREMVSELESLLQALDMPLSHVYTLCHEEQPPLARIDTQIAFESAIEKFLAAARAVLDEAV